MQIYEFSRFDDSIFVYEGMKDKGWDNRDVFAARFSSYDEFAKPYDFATSQLVLYKVHFS